MSEFPDLVQAVIGFRTWAIDVDLAPGPGGYCLRSAGMGDMRWAPGVNKARCAIKEINQRQGMVGPPETGEPEQHTAPKVDCGCGLYALNGLRPLGGTRAGLVIGAVQAWGEIAVHRTGFRTQYAKVVALGLSDHAAFDPEFRGVLEQLAAKYRCELVPLVELEEAAYKHGIRMPEALLPPEADPAEEFRSGIAAAQRVIATHGVSTASAMTHLGSAVQAAGHQMVSGFPGGRLINPPPRSGSLTRLVHDPPKPNAPWPLRLALAFTLGPLGIGLAFTQHGLLGWVGAALAGNGLVLNRVWRFLRMLGCWFHANHRPCYGINRGERCRRCGWRSRSL